MLAKKAFLPEEPTCAPGTIPITCGRNPEHPEILLHIQIRLARMAKSRKIYCPQFLTTNIHVD